MTHIVVTYGGIFNLVLSLHVKKPNGPDNIPTTFLRCYVWVSHILSVIPNAPLWQCTLPFDWANAGVKPIFK